MRGITDCSLPQRLSLHWVVSSLLRVLQVWILGRTYADSYNETDLAAANALIAQYSISPLFSKSYQAPKAVAQLAEQALVASGIPYNLDGGRNVSAFWQMTGAMAALNPPVTAADATAYAGVEVVIFGVKGFGVSILNKGELHGMSNV